MGSSIQPCGDEQTQRRGRGRTTENAAPRSQKGRGNDFHDAAERGDVNGVRRQLQRGVNPNIGDENGWTALHEACELGHIAVVEELLQNRADPNLASPEGWTPLMPATEKGRANIVASLLRHGAKAYYQDENGWTCLMEAAEKRQPECLRQLVSLDLDLNTKDHNGATALMAACEHGDVECVKLLWQNGANHELSGVSALDEARDKRQWQVVTYMEPIIQAERELQQMLASGPWDPLAAQQRLAVIQQIRSMAPLIAQVRQRLPTSLAATPATIAQPAAVGRPAASAAVGPGSRGPHAAVQQQAVANPCVESATDGDACIVCMSAKKTHAFLPCGHRCVCGPCGQLVSGDRGLCPVCRGATYQVIKIFT